MRDEGAEMALVLVDKQTVLAIKPQAFFFFFSAASLLPCPSPLSSPFSPLPMSLAPSPPTPSLQPYHPHTVQSYRYKFMLLLLPDCTCSGVVLCCGSSSGFGLVRSGLHQDVSLSSHLLSALLHGCIRQSTSVQIHTVLLVILHSLSYMFIFILCNSCPFLSRYVDFHSSFSYYPPSQLYCQPKYPAAIVYVPWFTTPHHCLAFAFSQTKLNPAYSTCRILFYLRQIHIDQCTSFLQPFPLLLPHLCADPRSAPSHQSRKPCHLSLRPSVVNTFDF